MAKTNATGKSSKSKRATRSIGSQLLLSVNGVLILLTAIFLAYDYQRDFGRRLEDKRIALHEEAKTLMPAVVQMQRHGRGSIQRYIDAVCGQMRDSQSPGHHIVVESPAEVIQASAHHRASPAMLQAIHRAAREPDQLASAGRDKLVVGAYTQGGTTVYVSEALDNIRRSVTGDVILRLMGLVMLAFAATAVVDMVLWRVVSRPIKRLVSTVQQIGKGELGVQAGSFHSMELEYLADEINAMSATLATVDRQRSLQMAKAREIQQSLLPKDVTMAGLRFSSLFLPAEDVGGDYYDVVRLRDGTDVICVADVTGHGVPAALNAMMLKVLLVEACDHHSDPAEILEFINRRLAGVCHTDGFVTMFVARFNTRQMTLQYANAGHESGLLLSADGEVGTLASTGMILGVIEDQSWTSRTVAIRHGDRLLLATDGVTEAMDGRGQMFGRERLRDRFEGSEELGIDDVLPAIRDAVAEHCGNRAYADDVTLLALEVTAQHPEEACCNRVSAAQQQAPWFIQSAAESK